MRQFPETRPDDEVLVVPGAVTDSEGGAVDPQPQISCEVSSTQPDIVEATLKGELAADDPRRVALALGDQQAFVVGLHYGTAKRAASGDGKPEFYETTDVKASFSLADNPALGPHEEIGETIQLVPGDPDAFTPARIVFPEDIPATPEPNAGTSGTGEQQPAAQASGTGDQQSSPS